MLIYAISYCSTLLLKKLSIKIADKIILVNEPLGYFQLNEKDISEQLCKLKEISDFIHLFARNKKDLLVHLKVLLKKIMPTTTIWNHGIKKQRYSYGCNGRIIRKLARENGLVCEGLGCK